MGEFVPLKKRGSTLLGLCPFHREKTPSFNVNITRNTYKCFGCGKGGDAISFLEEHEKLSYPEALRWLADRYQIEVEEKQASPEQAAERNHQESLLIVNQFAAQWFTEQMFNTEEGQAVGLSYFQERGLRKDSIESFQLGWCPENGESLTEAAQKAGYRLEFLEELGLTRSKEGRYWDFYRGRVIFPIQNAAGKVIAFGARTLRSGSNIPKYLNSPESPIYSKGEVLYGLHQARRAMADADMAYLVEGYMDLIAMHQAEIKNSVASSGTALSSPQLRMIRRYTRNITMLYDGDSAGLKAAMRGAETALEEDMHVYFAPLPQGEDPDSLLQRLGSEGMREFLSEKSQDIILYKTDLLLQEAGKDPVQKAAMVRDVVESISRVGDPIARSLYLKKCAEKMELPEAVLIQESNKALQQRMRRAQSGGGISLGGGAAAGANAGYGGPGVAGAGGAGSEALPPLPGMEGPDPQETKVPAYVHRERDLVRLLMESENYHVEEQSAISVILEQISDVDLEHPFYAEVVQEYRAAWSEGRVLGTQFFFDHERREYKELALELLHKPYEISPNWTLKHEIAITDRRFLIRKDIEKVVAYLKADKLDRLLAELHRNLKDASADESTDPSDIQHMLGLYQELRQARSAITGAAGQMLVKRDV